jgi:hypothetical protein
MVLGWSHSISFITKQQLSAYHRLHPQFSVVLPVADYSNPQFCQEMALRFNLIQ